MVTSQAAGLVGGIDATSAAHQVQLTSGSGWKLQGVQAGNPPSGGRCSQQVVRTPGRVPEQHRGFAPRTSGGRVLRTGLTVGACLSYREAQERIEPATLETTVWVTDAGSEQGLKVAAGTHPRTAKGQEPGGDVGFG